MYCNLPMTLILFFNETKEHKGLNKQINKYSRIEPK